MENSKTPIDIKTLIQTSTIEIYDKNKLIDKLQHHFSDEEQRLYVSNLFLYLNYHPINDFIINLDNVWKFIGFSNKANAKRLLKHNFKENIDYKIIFIRMDENQVLLIRSDEQKTKENRGGQPVIRTDDGKFKNETIMLNINTFKKLCLKANTENADKIHDYYIRLEMVYNELMKEQIEEQNKEKYQIEAQNAILQIELNEKERTINVLTKKTNKFKPGQSVYIFRSSYDNKNIYKIGRTKNCNEREYTHKTATFDGEIVHQVMCSNSCVLERVCHFILDKYRLATKREWFSSSLNTIINAVEYAKLILDLNINFENEELLLETKNFLDTIKQQTNNNTCLNNHNEVVIVNETRNEIYEEILNINENHNNVNENQNNINENVYENVGENEKICFTELNVKDYINNPNDFDKFIKDCCEIKEDYSLSYTELKNQYKIWSKSANHKQLKIMIEHLKNQFRSTMRRYNPLVSTSKLTNFFNGIKIKDEFYNFHVSTKDKIIENYLYHNCQRAPGYRVTINELFKDFENFCKEHYNFDVSYYYKEKVKAYFDTMFIRLRKGISNLDIDCRLGGWLGVALKSTNEPEPILNYNPKNRKVVKAVDVLTQEIVKEWQSVGDASDELKKSRTNVSGIIKRHNIINYNDINCYLI
jgi:hypothetical protein